MVKKEIVIRHNIDDIMECVAENSFRTEDMRSYYLDNKNRDTPINQKLLTEIKNIIKFRTENIDPNDSSLMSYIREYLNRICASNIKEIIDKLMLLNYSTIHHFELLADELITKSINDAMAHKGLESKDITLSEICVEVSRNFYPFCLQDNDITFGSVLGKKCSTYFKTFTELTIEKKGSKTSFMNKFNQYRINNYKGLTNLIGLLYVANLFPVKIIMSCINVIRKLVVESNLSQEECDNYYSGYDRLVTRLISKFDQKSYENVDSNLVTEFFEVLPFIKTHNDEILEKTNENSKTENRADRLNSIRKYSLSIHKLTMKKFSKLESVYTKLKEKFDNESDNESDNE
jgi:hypothetical protein